MDYEHRHHRGLDLRVVSRSIVASRELGFAVDRDQLCLVRDERVRSAAVLFLNCQGVLAPQHDWRCHAGHPRFELEDVLAVLNDIPRLGAGE